MRHTKFDNTATFKIARTTTYSILVTLYSQVMVCDKDCDIIGREIVDLFVVT